MSGGYPYPMVGYHPYQQYVHLLTQNGGTNLPMGTQNIYTTPQNGAPSLYGTQPGAPSVFGTQTGTPSVFGTQTGTPSVYGTQTVTPSQSLYGTQAGIPSVQGTQGIAPLGTASLLPQSYSALGTPGLAQDSVPGGKVPDVGGMEDPEDKEEYIKELIKEREAVENSAVSNLSKSHVLRLINQEITRLQGGGIFYGDDVKFMDVYREKCTRVTIRVLVPTREHPKFNFVGKLLGPKGNSLKRMQEETLTKMAVLGRGSMRDKEKEEELRASGDPKYGHLQEELHVEITAYAPPAEAYARLSFALTEVRKFLIPDSNDTIRQLQMRELEVLNTGLMAGVAGGQPMAPDSTSQLQLMTSPSMLIPSQGYHIPLLPTPPLDTSPSPTITALPTKYEGEEGGGGYESYKDKTKLHNRKFSPY